jgi:nucleoside-triphosphatase THEP1
LEGRPGVGKSTVADRLIAMLREADADTRNALPKQIHSILLEPG